MTTTRIRVRLRDVKPTVLRVFDVPSGCTLHELHELLQAAIGWENVHLHRFVTESATYGPAGDDLQERWDDVRVPLTRLPPAFRYEYDFADGWDHDVQMLGPGGDEPGLVSGVGRCPPEDCGGPGGYEEFRSGVADRTSFDHFDEATADRLVTHVAGELPGSVRLLLGLVGDGVRLTPRGRLPRATVRAIQAERPDWHPVGAPATRQEDLLPLSDLLYVLRAAGLLRLGSGILTVTQAGQDDRKALRKLRAWWNRDVFATTLVVTVLAVLANLGAMQRDQLSKHVFQLLGPDWTEDGQPLSQNAVHDMLPRYFLLLRALDLVDGPDFHDWAPGPSALTLLPRAAFLAGARTIN